MKAFFLAVIGCCASVALAYSERPVPKDFFDFKILEDGGAAYMLSGVPQRNMQTGEISFLAISPVNPLPSPDNAASEGYFAGVKHRPRTFSEAEQACQDYRLAGKQWHLPSLFELKQINYYVQFAQRVLQADDEATAPLRQHWASMPQFLNQYHFFWTNEPSKATGMRTAGTFGVGAKSQAMTAANPLSVICITYMEGTEREVDRMAIQEAAKVGTVEKAKG